MTLEPTLPASAYLDEDVFATERERIFASQWCLAAREDDAPGTGDWARVDVADESLLLVRGDDGELRAFFNVCRHRGAELVPPDGPRQGRAAGGLRCPYHAWTYGHDGTLRRAPFLGDLHELGGVAAISGSDEPGGATAAGTAAGAPGGSADGGVEAPGGASASGGVALHAAGAAAWGGFVFVHLEPGASGPLAGQLGPVPDRLRRYPLADLRRGEQLVYEVAANWKVLAENYNECYHCAPVHPELCDLVPSFRRGGGDGLEWERGIPHREGAWTFTASGTTSRAPFPGLDADERVRHKGELVYPNLLLSLAADHVAAFTLLPRSAGHTTVVCDFLFHPEEMARTEFDPSDAVDFWDVVNRQDWAVCESVQRGMGSRAFTQGWFAPMEDDSVHIGRWWSSLMGDAAPPGAGRGSGCR